MAITVRTTAQTGGAERKQKLHRGMAIALGVEITLGATADYTATGIGLSGIAKQLGFSRIIGAVAASVRASGGTLRAFTFLYDAANNSVRFYKTGSALSGALLEIVPGTDLAANDIVSLVVYGVP